MAKAVLSKEEAEKIAVAFSPRKFPVTISPVAAEFVQFQMEQENPTFRIDKIVAAQNGIADLERASIEEKVEREALARLKDLQEQAYQQAYQLGLDEGREMAFQEHKSEVEEKIQHLDELLKSVTALKSELVTFNETHIVKLVFYLARRIAMDEISARPEVILSVVRQAIENAQTEEAVTVRVSADDLAFIESVKEKLGKEMEALRKARFEESSEVASGGCVIATNYGDVDARLEKRVDKLWDSLSEKLPKVKDEAGG